MTLTVDELKELLILMMGTKGVIEIDEKAPISKKILNEFLDKKSKLDKDNPYGVTVTPLDYTDQTGKPPYQTGTPNSNIDPCAYCSNNPANGGSGICHCILGTPKVYSTSTDSSATTSVSTGTDHIKAFNNTKGE